MQILVNACLMLLGIMCLWFVLEDNILGTVSSILSIVYIMSGDY